MVDGLDEFDGDLKHLIRLFKDILMNGNIKVCVSSRPWVEFEDAFKNKPSLMLQDLTYTDIKHYVSATFEGDSGFAQLCRREPQYAAQLIEDIVDKASGVFLWVHLVVASLIAGMCYGDRVSDLKRRLDQLPGDLENLYKKIIMGLDPFYLEHTAQLFRLVRESIEPPSLLLLSFADEEDPGFALNRSVEPISQDEKSLRTETRRRRLNSRFKGLLEAGEASLVSMEDAEDTVQYLHRSVKDYMESADVQERFVSVISDSFDPHLMLCSGNLARLKALNHTIVESGNRAFGAGIRQCLYSASRIHANHRAYIIPFLDDIDNTGSLLSKRTLKAREDETNQPESPNFQLEESRQWAYHLRLRFGKPLLSLGAPNRDDVPSHPSLQEPFGSTFLSFATSYGIVEYVEAKANPGCLCILPTSYNNQNTTRPLLRDAISVKSGRHTQGRDAVPHLETIRCLLRKGADPNYRTGEGPVWFVAIDSVMQSFNGEQIEPPWSEVVALMIQHGAKVDKAVWKYISEHFWPPEIGIEHKKTNALYQQLLTIQRSAHPRGLSTIQHSISRSLASALPRGYKGKRKGT